MMRILFAFVMAALVLAAAASATDFNAGLVNYWNLSKMPDTNMTMGDVVGGADLPVGGSPVDAAELNPVGGVTYELSSGDVYDSYGVPAFGFGTNVTFNFWVNVTSAGVEYLYAEAGDAFAFNDRGVAILWVNPGGSWTYEGLMFNINKGDCGGDIYGLTYAMPSDVYNSWHMVSLVVTNESMSAYWDGSLINSTATPFGFCVDNSSVGFHMGMGDGNSGSRVLDEFGIWSYSMSDSQISELYNGGSGFYYPFTPSSPPTPPAVTISTVQATPSALLGECFGAGATNYSYAWFVNGSESSRGSTSSWSSIVATPYNWLVDGTIGTFVYRFNNELVNDLNLSSPVNVGLAVAVDADFNVYWSDYNQVWVSDALGNNLRNFSEGVRGIAVDKNGDVWMISSSAATKYNASGSLLVTINYDALYGFQGARGIIDHDNNLWVTRYAGANILMKFDSDGNNILNVTRTSGEYYANLAVDADNNIFTADYPDNTITKYDENGTQLAQTIIGTWAQAVVLDLDGNVWLADSWTGEVFKLDSDLNSLINLTLEGSNGASTIWADASNRIWVSDFTRLSVFNTSGNLLWNQTIGANIESWGDINGLTLQRLIGGRMPVLSNLTDFNAGDSVVFECSADGGLPLNSSVFVPSFSSGACVEDWTCTDWGDCVDSLQNRTCSDINLCGTNSSKPAELQSCSAPATPLPSVTGLGIFGLFAELGAGMAMLFHLIAMPLGVLLMAVAIIGAVMLIIGAVAKWLV